MSADATIQDTLIEASAPMQREPEAEAPKTTAAILEALAAHYRKPGEDQGGEILITEPQSPDGTRRADLVRVGLWQSRGTGIDVHEIKVSRGDWLRELADPAKAEAWWPYCNRFWVVALPGVVVPAELPAGWGLMVPGRSRRFRVVVKPAEKTANLTLPLMIELMRRADNARVSEIDSLRREHRADVARACEAVRQQRATTEMPLDLRQRVKFLERIEQAIGLRITEYAGWGATPQDITPAELAALMRDAGDHVAAQRLREDAERLRRDLERTMRRFMNDLEITAKEAS